MKRFDDTWIASNEQTIVSQDHLCDHLYRLFIDSLFYFGNDFLGVCLAVS